MHYLLVYDVAKDYIQRRAALRKEHLTLAWREHERGELVIAGALDAPVDQTMLLFHANSPLVAEQFAKADPYVRHGLVVNWRVRPWVTVVGRAAATPVRPEDL